MIGVWLVPVLSAGLFGSLHCVGMCGGLIAVASDGAAGIRERAAVQAVYQIGRLVSYVVLGAVAGSLGRALDLVGRAAGLGEAAAIVAGATMALWGLAAMLNAAGVRLPLPGVRLLPNAVLSWLGRARSRPPVARAALLGSASALLPCGFLYAFALAAAATSSAAGGALVMGALWLGNLPALLGFGLALGGALARLRRHLPMLGATAVFALGVFTLSSRVNVPAFAAGLAARPTPPSDGTPMPADCPHHRKQQP
jgi:sulfite exporter TauE/SafE